MHAHPLQQNHIYTDLLPYLFGAVSQRYLSVISWAVVLILPPIKLNSQLSHSAMFSSWQYFVIITAWIKSFPLDTVINNSLKNA